MDNWGLNYEVMCELCEKSIHCNEIIAIDGRYFCKECYEYMTQTKID